jgi:TetR/AcrR family transcriptional regulator
MPRSPKSIGTRERMLDVAERLFARHGYEGTHLEEIATQVGVRKTALYYYFESKEALYLAVLENMLEPMAETVLAIFHSDEPIRERAGRLVDFANELLAGRPSYAQIVIRVFIDRVPLASGRVGPILQNLVAAATKFFEQGIDEGVFRKLSPIHVFQSALGMAILHYASAATAAGLLDRDENLFDADAIALRREQYRELLFHGVMAEPAPEPDA